MQRKYLQKIIKLTENEESKSFSEPIELEYYLVESKIDNEDFNGIEMYGIQIVKKIGKDFMESEFVRNITFNKDNAIDMIDKIARNTVTPMTLKYIVYDLISA